MNAEYDLMKYKMANDALGIALWDMDVVTENPESPENKLRWSQELRDMLGFFDENDFPNTIEALADRFHPDDSEKVFAAFAAHFNDKSGETPYNIEYRLKHKNGEYKWFHGFGTTLRDDDGTPLRIAGAVMDINERKQTEKQLMIMSSIVQNSPNFTSYKEINGDCLYVNPAAVLTTGYSEEELKSDYLGTLFSEGTAKLISEKVVRDLSESGLSRYEAIGKTKKGEERIFAGTSFLIEQNAFATVASDVTELKKIEAEKTEALNTMKNILDALDAIIYVTDPKTGEILFMNESMRKHYGIGSNMDGHICYKVLQEGIDERCDFCPCNKLDKEPNSVIVWETVEPRTNRVLRKTDRYIKWPDGRTVHLQHSVDITDLIKANESLENHKRMLDTLNNTAIMFLSQNDEKFEEMMTSGLKLFCDELGIDRVSVWRNSVKAGKLRGSQIYRWDRNAGGTTKPTPGLEDITYKEFAPRWEKLLGEGGIINSPIELLPEAAILRSFGVISAFVTPMFINDVFWGFVLFEDRRNERYFNDNSVDVMRSAAFLCANTVIRSEMVLNLREASESATAASKAKGDFLSHMSHEMRTPLNAIIGMTTIGKKANDTEQKNYSLNRIGDASSHLLGIINDVLDMAKIEANKLELTPVEFHFERMLQHVLTVVGFRADEKRQKLSMNIDKNMPCFIIGDDQRLTQVITNLLSNAVKFTPEQGEIRLDAFVNGESDGVYELRIEVVDSGIGISPDKIKKLFQPFGQAESDTSREYGGTGLGLVISKLIIELMDGKIWVESALGQGAKFIFTIKVGRSDRSADSVPIQSGDEKTVMTPGEFKGKKLLIAEDIEINREIFIALLEETGIDIDCAENGAEALAILEAAPNKYDIVFMDVQMPVMDGLEAARRVRKSQKKPPIIAMTANVFKSDIEECLAAGMDDHIGKPLDTDVLFKKLHKYLKKG